MSKVEPVSGQGPDTGAFRRALGCFVTGVTIVTARGADGRAHGFTANSFTSVSLDPPLVLVCVGHETQSLEIYRQCPQFAVNVLGSSQRAISNRFATERPDRFAGVRWREGMHRLPILEGCIAALECAVWQRIEAGDHMILVGRVLGCEDSPEPPLAFWRGSYRSLAVHRDGSVREDGRPVPVVP